MSNLDRRVDRLEGLVLKLRSALADKEDLCHVCGWLPECPECGAINRDWCSSCHYQEACLECIRRRREVQDE